MSEEKEESYIKELVVLIGLLIGSYIYCRNKSKLLKLRPIIKRTQKPAELTESPFIYAPKEKTDIEPPKYEPPKEIKTDYVNNPSLVYGLLSVFLKTLTFSFIGICTFIIYNVGYMNILQAFLRRYLSAGIGPHIPQDYGFNRVIENIAQYNNGQQINIINDPMPPPEDPFRDRRFNEPPKKHTWDDKKQFLTDQKISDVQKRINQSKRYEKIDIETKKTKEWINKMYPSRMFINLGEGLERYTMKEELYTDLYLKRQEEGVLYSELLEEINIESAQDLRSFLSVYISEMTSARQALLNPSSVEGGPLEIFSILVSAIYVMDQMHLIIVRFDEIDFINTIDDINLINHIREIQRLNQLDMNLEVALNQYDTLLNIIYDIIGVYRQSIINSINMITDQNERQVALNDFNNFTNYFYMGYENFDIQQLRTAFSKFKNNEYFRQIINIPNIDIYLTEFLEKQYK